MRSTFVGASNEATNGVALGVAGQDITVFKVIIGNPIAAKVVRLYNSAVAFQDQSENVAVEITQPTFGAGNDAVREVDFGPNGLRLDGGNVQIDDNMDVTVLWEVTEQIQ